MYITNLRVYLKMLLGTWLWVAGGIRGLEVTLLVQ